MSRLNEALQELAKAAGEVVAAFADLIAEAFAPLSLEQVEIGRASCRERV